MSFLGESDWLAIEQLNDMVYSTGETNSILFSSLDLILTQFGSPAGALYLPGYGQQYEWVECNSPKAWRLAVQDEQSQLFGLLRRCLNQATAMPGIEALRLKSILPILDANGVIGALLVNASTTAENVRWLAYLRALARVLSVQRRSTKTYAEPKESEVLRVFADAQNKINDPDKMTFQMTAGIRDAFDAEDGILVLFDEESPDLVICKRLGANGSVDWLSQYSVRLGSQMAHRMASTYYALVADDIFTEPGFDLIFRSETDLQIDAITSSPIKGNNGKMIGVMILVNQPMISLSDQQPTLLTTATAGLANLIQTARLITLLKISNADLEALRWELTNSRNILRALFDSLPSSIYIVDQVYNLIAINASRAARVNQSPSALVGRKCYEKLYNRTEPCKGCMVAETMRTGNDMQWLNREWGNDDTYKEWDVKTFSVCEKTEKPLRTIIVEEDITAQRAMETSLAQYEKMAVIGQLATGVAQEIHNPLTAILANAQVLKHSIARDQDDLLDSIQLIESAGKHILQVAQNLLGVAQKGRYEFLPCDLNETITNAFSLVQHEVSSRQVNVRMALEEMMPPISVSKDHLQDVWINLMLAGIESLDKEEKNLEICSYYEDGWFHLMFKDNGRGLLPEKIEHIFDPVSGGKRNGVNLYNCKKVIHQHGGSIQVESQVGEWTRYNVTLPAQNREMVVKERGRTKEYELTGIR